MRINNDFFQLMHLHTLKTVFLAAILDYVNMTLPHVNSDDPIGFLVQFNVYIGLKTALLHSIILSCIVRPFAGGHLEYLKLLKGARVASTGFRKYRVK